jgi:tetratricopeptide (TPR) repeat protein
MIKSLVCFAVALQFCGALAAQETAGPQEKFIESEYFLMNEDYNDALQGYLELYEKLPENANLAYCIGVCYLNIPGMKNLSVSYLEAAARNISATHREGSLAETAAPYEALFYLATSYRVNYRFDKAREIFQKYEGTLLPDDKENIDFIKHEIEVCDMAKDLIAHPVSFVAENMGELFNDEKSQFNPLISADGKSFAWMVGMKFYDAVMFSKLNGSKWSPPENITPDLQSDGDFYISCLSSDGKSLYLSKDDNDNSDIYSSVMTGDKWGKCTKLNRNINTKYWESHGFVSEDGETLIFASDRPGGFGGLDLYLSRKVGGDWGPAVNMGPEINTPFNEDRPFLINRGRTLFFCSQGHENIGGYDLFRSDIQINKLWSKPKNLGYPLNTPDDNVFFMPAGDGSSGYCSLMKEAEGFGREDLYRITFK